MNEADLINAIRTADKDAFKSLCELYYEPLFRFLWRKTRDEEVAKDLVQDLFLNLWNNRANLDGSKPIRPYLYRAANNLAINHLKKKVVRQSHLADSAGKQQAEQTDTAQAWQELTEDALFGLPEDQREVFMLNKFEGLKYKEIAEMKQISVKTVESKMSKALKFLREKLGAILPLLFFLQGFYGGVL